MVGCLSYLFLILNWQLLVSFGDKTWLLKLLVLHFNEFVHNYMRGWHHTLSLLAQLGLYIKSVFN